MDGEPDWLHELRGTLAAVRVWSEVLRQSSDETERARALDRIDLGVIAAQRLLAGVFVQAANGAHEIPTDYLSENAVARLDEIAVLVVEDDEDLRSALVALLEQLGARVAAVESAEAALERLEQETPNVIVCDVHLPGLGGVAFLKALRARPGGSGKPIPAIALTAAATPADVEVTRAAGFALHLVKPPRLSDLTWALAKLARRA